MNKTVIITGVGQGLAFCLAKKHLAMGDTVYGLEVDIIDQTRALAEKYPETFHLMQCDVTSTEQVEHALAPVVAAGKQVDYLYSVAGVFHEEERVGVADTDIDGGMKGFVVNALGGIRVIRPVASLLGKGTVIILVTSEAGSVTNCRRPNMYLYNMAKAAANMSARVLSNEFYEKGVRVFAIHPGWMKTKLGGITAAESPTAIQPEESADGIWEIASNAEHIPPTWEYMTYQGDLMPW